MKNYTYNRKKMLVIFIVTVALAFGMIGRLAYLMIIDWEYYRELADDLHERERAIKAARGEIIDRNGVVLAANETVCTISVVHSQVKDEERIIEVLSDLLEINKDEIAEIIAKNTSMEKIKSNVSKEIGDAIREEELPGIKVDEDYKRYYPYNELASKVLGFTGSDNQGIIGLEVEYDQYLQGTNGTILTTTDATGIELDRIAEERVEPIAGNTLQISLDYNIQTFIQQKAEILMQEKEATAVQCIAMNPQNGEVLAMVNVPEFNLNDPFTLNNTTEEYSADDKQNMLNQMWRNGCINDTYEPGSIFKIITSASALEEGVVTLEDQFVCTGACTVEGTTIHCHKYGGHGPQTFIEAVQNSCNPAFINVGLRLGAETFYSYLDKFGLLTKTNIDLPGEAGTIMHDLENINAVELATISFGQSFQITPIQLATTVSSIINGGNRVTPHLGMKVYDANGMLIQNLEYEIEKGIVSEETSELMQMILESVVSDGSGIHAYLEGYKIGGKTATSQTLPRSENVYISSFLGFAPADNPEILIISLVYDPQGVYYGGTIVAPVVGEIFDNVLPYLGVEKSETVKMNQMY